MYVINFFFSKHVVQCLYNASVTLNRVYDDINRGHCSLNHYFIFVELANVYVFLEVFSIYFLIQYRSLQIIKSGLGFILFVCINNNH
jgi:hypothetical protein